VSKGAYKTNKKKQEKKSSIKIWFLWVDKIIAAEGDFKNSCLKSQGKQNLPLVFYQLIILPTLIS
jgi:hypothetical protein